MNGYPALLTSLNLIENIFAILAYMFGYVSNVGKIMKKRMY